MNFIPIDRTRKSHAAQKLCVLALKLRSAPEAPRFGRLFRRSKKGCSVKQPFGLMVSAVMVSPAGRIRGLASALPDGLAGAVAITAAMRRPAIGHTVVLVLAGSRTAFYRAKGVCLTAPVTDAARMLRAAVQHAVMDMLPGDRAAFHRAKGVRQAAPVTGAAGVLRATVQHIVMQVPPIFRAARDRTDRNRSRLLAGRSCRCLLRGAQRR